MSTSTTVLVYLEAQSPLFSRAILSLVRIDTPLSTAKGYTPAHYSAQSQHGNSRKTWTGADHRYRRSAYNTLFLASPLQGVAPLSHDFMPVAGIPTSRRQPRPFIFAVFIIAGGALPLRGTWAVFAGHFSISQSVNLLSTVGFPSRTINAPFTWVSAVL